MGFTWEPKTVYQCLVGGAMIGLCAGVRMVYFGRVTGASGVLNDVLEPSLKFDTVRIQKSK
jgi:hypothetical protein